MPKTMRVMEITTPLGDDVLLFHSLHAREELSRLGEYQLELLSPKANIKADDILGKNVTVKLVAAATAVWTVARYPRPLA